MISSKLLKFLREPRIQELIDSNDWDTIYYQAKTIYIGELTWLLYDTGIDPLKYLNKIPSYFLHDTDITSFEIPQHITIIGAAAFLGCSGLTSITIPDNVTSVGCGAFYGCSGLTGIIIPDSVTNIGEDAFYGCSGLKNINYKGTIAQWRRVKKAGAFDNNITVHCINGDLQLQDKTWVKI